MAIETTVDRINLSVGIIEATVTFWEKSGPTHNAASVTVFVEARDWLLSELRAEAIEKAKAFLLQAASSPQS
jgi:hypothetical protein